jgi:membrane associated rhomboid family serine protease
MLLIPIGRDDAEIRRHAWISYVILTLNALAFCVTATMMRPSTMQKLQNEWQSAFEFYVRHPYLKPPPALEELLPEETTDPIQNGRKGAPSYLPKIQITREQRVLDSMVEHAVELRKELPFARFGYTPAEGGLLTLLTSMFIHAGFLHLLGNMLFFYLSGPFIEDVFGRPLFLALYFLGGLAAVFTFATRDPQSTTPLVGASGAIAAVMGAYLFRFYRSKVELLFVPFLWRPMLNFRFFMPAFVVLPLWFGQQLLEMRSENDGGVAFSAHVGGFVFGFAFAAVMKVVDFEKKYVDPMVTKQTTWVMDDRLARAIAARQRGALTEAKADLAGVLRDDPKNIDALRTALDVAYGENDWAYLDGVAARLLTAYIEEKHFDAARELVSDVSQLQDARVPKFLARAAGYIERLGDREWALMLYEQLYDADPVGPNAVGTLVKTSALLRAAGEPLRARDMLRKARAHPACNAEWAHTIDSKLEAFADVS